MIYFIISLLIAIGAVIFAISNSQIITIQFLTWQFEGSLALILVIAFVVGVIFTLTATIPSYIKLFLKTSHFKKKLYTTEAENSLKQKEIEKRKLEERKPEAQSPQE